MEATQLPEAVYLRTVQARGADRLEFKWSMQEDSGEASFAYALGKGFKEPVPEPLKDRLEQWAWDTMLEGKGLYNQNEGCCGTVTVDLVTREARAIAYHFAYGEAEQTVTRTGAATDPLAEELNARTTPQCGGALWPYETYCHVVQREFYAPWDFYARRERIGWDNETVPPFPGYPLLLEAVRALAEEVEFTDWNANLRVDQHAPGTPGCYYTITLVATERERREQEDLGVAVWPG